MVEEPISAPASACLAQRTTEGQQAGAVSQRAALPPLLPFGLSPDEHFQQAVNRIGVPKPTERSLKLDLDLEFAAEYTARLRGSLREVRQDCVAAPDGGHPSCHG